MSPLFSIITVTYNAGRTLPVTLKSVREQTCRNYEYLIVDGVSSDRTLELARHSGIDNMRIVSDRDCGIYDAMNRGLDMAQGEYVIFMNAGDRFHSPDVLALYEKAIMDNDFPGIVYGQTELMDSDGCSLGPRHLSAPRSLTLNSFAEGMMVCHQAMAVLKRITSPYNLEYKYSADYEWVIRCLQHSMNNVYVPEIVVDYLYEGTTTAHRWDSLGERFRIMAFYYGWFPTVMRHLKFIPRFIKHKFRIERANKRNK